MRLLTETTGTSTTCHYPPQRQRLSNRRTCVPLPRAARYLFHLALAVQRTCRRKRLVLCGKLGPVMDDGLRLANQVHVVFAGHERACKQHVTSNRRPR